MKKSPQEIVRRTRGRDTANTLSGLEGNDTLDGGKGADTMLGGAGALVEAANDAVFEMRMVG